MTRSHQMSYKKALTEEMNNMEMIKKIKKKSNPIKKVYFCLIKTKQCTKET